MISIVLSERDFDYELQALTNSFFPAQKISILEEGHGEEPGRERLRQVLEEASACIGIYLGTESIRISILFKTTCQGRGSETIIKDRDREYWKQAKKEVTGGEDWHKHQDKTAHPYRTYYKNELKRLLFLMLREIPEELLPEGMIKRVPDWGTMTGVRPTKIPMNELLQGKSVAQVRQSLGKWYCCKEEKQELCLEIALREAELLRQVNFEEGYSLYIGIPFCPTTCLYCSFPSYPYDKFCHLADDYLEALKKELVFVAERCRGRRLTSIYIGGGTPTALEAGQLDELLCCVRRCFPEGEFCEFTVEAGRPDSITEEKLKVLNRYRVGRISVNPQTMQQRTLDLIGRKHTVADTAHAFHMAREIGFSNINMDLIIGLPGETAMDFEDTLNQVRELGPDSVTVHSLGIKRASRLRGVLEEGGNPLERESERERQMEQMLALSRQFASEEAYRPYYMYRQKNSAGHFGSSGQENIGYARKGKECLYNILIMEEMQTIMAVGAGASTKLYNPGKKIVSRVENVKSITDYIGRIDEMLSRKEKMCFQTCFRQ